MALGGSNLKVSLRGLIQGQKWQVGCWYTIGGAAFLTATPVGVGEAYWNFMKTAWRALQYNTVDMTTLEVFVEEPGVSGQYGTFAVPSGEQKGTRALAGGYYLCPPFDAYGIRQTVGSRVTRPGQKRIPGIGTQDINTGDVISTTQTLLAAATAQFTAVVTLGSPVATGLMTPAVCRINPTTREILAQQAVTGYIINNHVTSQVSRKAGRGV